jgi:hypothetical protein
VEEVEEAKSNVMFVERHDICLGNVSRGKNKEEEKHTFLKPGRMRKQKK